MVEFKPGDLVRYKGWKAPFKTQAEAGALATVMDPPYEKKGALYLRVHWLGIPKPTTQLDGGYWIDRFELHKEEEAPKVKAKRRKNDFYPTPAVLTLALIKEMGWNAGNYKMFYEPCNGRGDISKMLETVSHASNVYTADIDPTLPGFATRHRVVDARKGWSDFLPEMINWVVTNPPFNCAYEILENIVNHRDNIKEGFAFLLRLSFLEPTVDRANFLSVVPPTKLIVLPRVSFTGDGKTDSVTCAWMVWEWDKIDSGEQKIKVYSKEDLKLLKDKWKARIHGKNYGKD